jgi:hypothetical protein
MVVNDARRMTPPATEKSASTGVPGAPSRPRFHSTNMDELAKSAQEVLNYMENKANNDPVVVNFIRNVKDLAETASKNTQLDKVWKALDLIQRDTAQIRKDITKTSTSDSTDSALIWRTFRAKDWQAGIKSASAPLSQGTGSSTPGITPAELGRDSEITVKIHDADIRDRLRRSKPLDIVHRVEQARGEAAKKTNSPALAGAAVIAARQLPSGDVSLRASSAAAAEVLRKYASHWMNVFGGEASIRTPTWGVVAHGIPVASMELKPDTMHKVIAPILAQNPQWGKDARINHIGWLVRPRKGKREGSVVIEFLHPEDANEAIQRGTIWEGQIHDTAILCREGRSKLCNKCQKPGHVQIQCPNRPVCGTCAECSSNLGREVPVKCAYCKGEHKASWPKCPTQIEAMQRSKAAIMRCEPLHRVPEYMRRKPMVIFGGQATQSIEISTNPRKRQAAAEPGSPERESAVPLINLVKPTAPKQKRGRPTKPKSSLTRESNTLPDRGDAVTTAYSATQSQRSTRLGEPVAPMTDPEQPLRGRQRSGAADEALESSEMTPIPSLRDDNMDTNA